MLHIMLDARSQRSCCSLASAGRKSDAMRNVKPNAVKSVISQRLMGDLYMLCIRVEPQTAHKTGQTSIQPMTHLNVKKCRRRLHYRPWSALAVSSLDDLISFSCCSDMSYKHTNINATKVSSYIHPTHTHTNRWPDDLHEIRTCVAECFRIDTSERLSKYYTIIETRAQKPTFPRRIRANNSVMEAYCCAHARTKCETKICTGAKGVFGQTDLHERQADRARWPMSTLPVRRSALYRHLR